MNKGYWSTFYKRREQQSPSDFAYFCLAHIKPKTKILDVGAGDGRDALLLQKNGSVVMVEPNNDLREFANKNGIGFYKKPLESFSAADIRAENRTENLVVYTRWFLHAVPEHIEDILIEFAAHQRASIMAEFRVIGDKPDNTHERRLIDPAQLTHKLLERGFVIKHLSTGYNYSKYKDDNPYLGRVIAEYKGR